MDPVEKAAQELATDIATIKRTQDAQGGQLSDMKVGIDALQARMTAIQQAQDAQNRERVERAASGDESELDRYIARDAPSAPNAEHYRMTDAGIVRLTGHFEQRVARDGSSYKVWMPGLLTDLKPRTQAQLQLQRAIERRSIARAIMRKEQKFTPQLDEEVLEAARACGGLVAKILADSSGIGAAWTPDVTVPELEREVLVPAGLAGIFKRREINGNSLKIPKIAGRVRFYINRVPTSNDPAGVPLSDITDSEGTITTQSSAGGIQFDRDWDEDSIIAVIPEVQAKLLEGWRWNEDDGIMNADDAASHQDAIASWDPRGMLGGTTGLGTVIDARRRWNGLRARAKDLQAITSSGATDQSAAQDFAGLKVALAKLGPANLMQGYFGQTGSIVTITSWEYFFKTMLGFAEFISWEKVGALAAVLTGQLGNPGQTPGGMLPGQVGFVGGMVPVIVASALTADLAVTGLYTGSGSTTGMIQVDRSRFEYVIRKSLTLEQEVDIRNNTTTVVARGRSNFRAQDAVAAGIRDTHYSYNLTA